MSAFFEVSSLGVRFGDTTIVNDINLDFREGEVTALLGHNGSGKSTLLKVLARQLAPAKGEVRLLGNRNHRADAREFARTVGYLPQHPPGTEGLTVSELVALGRYPWRGPLGRYTPDDYALIDQAIADTGLTPFRHRSVDTLSGGERQRAWIALLLTQKTRCLLLLEPNSSLVVKYQLEALCLVHMLAEEWVLAVVAFLHYVDLLSRFCQLLVAVAGRLIRNRGAFMEIQDMSGRIQLYVNKAARAFAKSLDLGDIVGVKGELHKSGKGDLYVDMAEYELLTKALRPLPDKHHGLADQELRYRQRYVDLIVNEESRNTFIARSKIVEAIRHYLAAERFLEVETPMMHSIQGGATARPFATFHNALDMDLFLRIAPELYLKRLVVGGFEKVFEINRNFRNEGLSTRHNPEFTMVEFYQAYEDYNDLMNLTEEMLRGIAKEVCGNEVVIYPGEKFDFGKHFARITLLESNLHFNSDIKLEQLQKLEAAR